MGNDTLISAARAAGFAMAPSDDLLTPATRRGADQPPPGSPDAPGSETQRVERVATAAPFSATLWWPFWKTA